MDEPATSPNAPLTQDAFLRDREETYALFGNMTFYGTGGVVILLVLLAIFLV
jgi:Bacterial aa3 type cytochrome c oxidase subunit IV